MCIRDSGLLFWLVVSLQILPHAGLDQAGIRTWASTLHGLLDGHLVELDLLPPEVVEPGPLIAVL
eukprot:7467934-Alexandrium_andersonii.AAC.1